jgi:hypothetical protein
MSITPSQRSSREILLFVLTLVVVVGICGPLWYWLRTTEVQFDPEGRWTPNRVGRLLLGPEQIMCYVCCIWAGLILLRRRMEVLRQRQAFRFELLPTEEGSRILPEDARPLLRKLDTTVGGRGPYILAHMVRMALGKYAISHSAPDVGEVVRTQADVEMGRLVSGMATVQYLAWAIPAIGFVGTVRGLAGSFTMVGSQIESSAEFLEQATRHLNFAFDCTLVALVLSLVVMYLLHTVQREEETLIIDCQQYCQEHLLLRLYDPHPEAAPVA